MDKGYWKNKNLRV